MPTKDNNHNPKKCIFCKKGPIIIDFNKKIQALLTAHWKAKNKL